jgi:hypothetical protein
MFASRAVTRKDVDHENRVDRPRHSRHHDHFGLRRVLHILLMIRALLVALIALSVAMLPAAGGGALKAKSTEMTEMSASEPMDCCPPAANPCDKAMDDCGCMATCALKCFSFAATSFSNIEFPMILASLSQSFASNPFHPQAASPPFRPPRV